MITKNERKVLKYILSNFDSPFSINQVARDCNLSPNGTYKILTKFEKEEVLKHSSIANIKSYSIDFDSVIARKVLELVLFEKLEGRIEARFQDLKPLRNLTSICVIFGSYLTKNRPNDIDILFVLKKEVFHRYKKELGKLKEIIPTKVHDIVQTEEDFAENLRKKDKILRQAIRNGKVLWGQEKLVEVISDISR